MQAIMEWKGLRGVPGVLLLALVVWWVSYAMAAMATGRVMLWRGGEEASGNSDVSGWTLAFQQLRWVDLTALQHLTAALVTVVWLKLTGRPIFPDNARGMASIICIAGVAHLAGSLATNVAYALISSSTARVVKAFEPLFTLLLSICLYKHHTDINISAFLSVVMVVLGAVIFTKEDATFNTWCLLAASVSNLAFPVRNIFLRNLSSAWDSALQKFAVVSMLSAVLLCPVSAVKLVLSGGLPSFAPTDGLVSSVFHTAYSMGSLVVLEHFSPVTHAIFSVAKRACTISANVIYLQVPVSWSLLISLGVIFLGCYFYHHSHTYKNKFLPLKCFILFAYSIYSVASYGNMLLSSTTHQTGTSSSCAGVDTRISTSWLFDRDMPEAVISNVLGLAEDNPHVPVHVYCGTMQCVHSLSNKSQLRVEFVDVAAVVRGTPLEPWLARHALNKVLSGRVFENHLHDVTKLGLLWKYGGIYVDPRVRPREGLGCVTSTAPWMSRVVGERGLDMAYFPKNHSFIHKLALRYVRKYPTRGTDRRPFHFQFWPGVAPMLHDEACLDCPSVVGDLWAATLPETTPSGRGMHYGTLIYNIRVQVATEVNLGDEVQGFPGIQYLPYVDTYLERDRMNVTSSPNNPNVTTFFNAWWGADDALWPPAKNIEPVMVSVHIGQDMYYQWQRHIDYLKDKQPIGCRDHSTLEFLRGQGVNAYFSGCMTLMMKNPNIGGKRNDVIYMVDVTDEIRALFPMEIQMKAVSVSHAYFANDRYENLVRFSEAYHRLVEYGSAKLVITQRIHCALPCVAMGTPVIFVDFPGLFGATDTKSSPRTAGLTPMFHTVDLYTTSRIDAVQWLQKFPWNNPPPNPNFGLMMKLKATLWNSIRQHRAFYDSARRFGLLPLTRLSSMKENSSSLTFHLVLGSPQPSSGGRMNWRVWRCIEAIFYHHPSARVRLYSEGMRESEVSVLTEAGYQIRVHNHSLEELLGSLSLKPLLPKLKSAPTDQVEDLLGMLLLHCYGGVYINTATVLVRPLDTLQTNTLGYQDTRNKTLSSSFMRFEKAHAFLHACVDQFKEGISASDLLTQVWKAASHNIHVLSHHAFNMFQPSQVRQQCLQDTVGAAFDTNTKVLTHDAYSVFLAHSDTAEISDQNKLKRNTLCNTILNSFCVLCNHIY